MATKTRWKDLLASRDLSTALPAVLHHLEGELAAQVGGDSSLSALAQVIITNLSHGDVSNPSRSLLAASALLAALDYRFPHEEATLMSEAVVKSVVVSSASSWPLVAALSVRCLCCLVVASQRHQQSKEERQEKQAWSRKVVPQIKAALDAHPKSFHVQEAVAEGCCVLFLEPPNLGGHIASLWPILWPLVVHPRLQIAQASSLALCRMTWLSRRGETDIPSAEKAMELVSTEVTNLFNQSVLPSLGKPNPGAILQCVRLLDFLQDLLLFSRSRSADLPVFRRSERNTGGELEETLVLLPLPKIMTLVELLLGSLLRESQVAAEICGNQTPTSELLKLLKSTLELLCVAVEVAGSSLLMFSGQIRKWLELLTDRNPKTDGSRHCVTFFKLIRRLEGSAPALLLRQPLLTRLCQYLLDAMHHEALMHSGEVQLHVTKKRKADALREDNVPNDAEGQILFSSACEALTRLIDSGSSLMSQAIIGSICEQVVQTIWHGLLYGTSRSVSGKEIDKCLAYRRVCRDPASVLGLLDVIRVLLQPRQMEGVPLAPSLLHAFAALINALQDAIERHALSSLQSLQGVDIRLRIREILDLLRFDRFGSNKVKEGMGIVWPEGESTNVMNTITFQDSCPTAPETDEQKQADPTDPIPTLPADESATKDALQEKDAADAIEVEQKDPDIHMKNGTDVTMHPADQGGQPQVAEENPATETVVDSTPEPAEVTTEAPSVDVEAAPLQVLPIPIKTAETDAAATEEFFTPRNAPDAGIPTLPEPTEPPAIMELFSPRSASPELCLDSPSE